jgi:hypothetical protein
MDRLLEQVRRMTRLTPSPQVLEVPQWNGQRKPRVVSGRSLLGREGYAALDLENYFVQRVLNTFDGDTRPDFVKGIQSSDLTQIHLLAKMRD